MLLNNYFCIFVALMFNKVRSQVCTRNVKTMIDKTDTFVVTERPCFTCAPINVSKTKSVRVPVKITVTDCCQGYRKENEKLEASSTNCVRKHCGSCKNGECSPTNECICYNSYEMYPPNSNTCVPKCDSRYERVNGDCQPHCSKPCLSGTCVAPEECSCYQGWDMNDQGNCIPTCNPDCGNGTCVDVNKCNCWIGYELRENASPQCVPSCRDCHGDCVAPDKCKCREPYTTKYMTADYNTCQCVNDCDTKCSTSICVLNASPSTPSPKLTTENVNMANEDKSIETISTSNREPKIYLVYSRTPNPNTEKRRKKNQEINDWRHQFWNYYFAFTIIVSFILSGYILWELYKK